MNLEYIGKNEEVYVSLGSFIPAICSCLIIISPQSRERFSLDIPPVVTLDQYGMMTLTIGGSDLTSATIKGPLACRTREKLAELTDSRGS